MENEDSVVLDFYRQMTYGNQFINLKEASNIDDVINACVERAFVSSFRETAINIYHSTGPDFDKSSLNFWEKYISLSSVSRKGVKITDKDKKNYKIAFNYFLSEKITKQASNIIKDILKAEINITQEKINDFYKNNFKTEEFYRFKDKNSFNFGLAQKIINMAIKFLYCYSKDNAFHKEKLGIETSIKKFNFKNADCPIDTQIINKIKKFVLNFHIKHVWSKMENEEYELCQETIDEINKKSGKSYRLQFDFDNWNNAENNII